MIKEFIKINSLKGKLLLPGDKSISHRAVMFAAMANGKSNISNCSNSEDVNSTMNCFKQLGAEISFNDKTIEIIGLGFKNLVKSNSNLNAGNSGTTARLISGILSAQNFSSNINGDESLSARPMMRIVKPLQSMGAKIKASESGTLPITINPSDYLHAIDYEMEISSAQVKSAIILAAIHLSETTSIIERNPTRNHTENMLGVKTEKLLDGKKIFASKENYPNPFEMTIPSDISSASFFIVLTLLSKNSELIIQSVSLNETRTGILEILKRMGANIEIDNIILENGEMRGDIIVKSSKLKNVDVPSSIIPNIIDEIPILSVAGVFAEGNFRISKAKELRVKESDRIKSICNNFKLAGLNIVEFEDGFEISGIPTNAKVAYESYGDHRIAMAFAVMAMLSEFGGSVNQFEAVNVSNPDFLNQIKAIV